MDKKGEIEIGLGTILILILIAILFVVLLGGNVLADISTWLRPLNPELQNKYDLTCEFGVINTIIPGDAQFTRTETQQTKPFECYSKKASLFSIGGESFSLFKRETGYADVTYEDKTIRKYYNVAPYTNPLDKGLNNFFVTFRKVDAGSGNVEFILYTTEGRQIDYQQKYVIVGG